MKISKQKKLPDSYICINDKLYELVEFTGCSNCDLCNRCNELKESICDTFRLYSKYKHTSAMFKQIIV